MSTLAAGSAYCRAQPAILPRQTLLPTASGLSGCSSPPGPIVKPREGRAWRLGVGGLPDLARGEEIAVVLGPLTDPYREMELERPWPVGTNRQKAETEWIPQVVAHIRPR